jgi:arylsulfatase A-like enzyme
MRSEATAEDLNERALAWVDEHRLEKNTAPFLLWVHYTEPHAPYVQRDEYLDQLGIQQKKDGKKLPAIDRYDTEIAYVDAVVGKLVADLEKRVPRKELLLVLVADHGESLGEHKYWGHGRNLYEPNLRIPMAIVWEGKLEPRAITAPSLIIDLAPTLAVLLGFEAPTDFVGFDWTGTLNGDAEPFDRVTHYEAHKGAVITAHDSDLARRSGLLAVALMQRNQKEIFRVKGEQHWSFDLVKDPGELISRSPDRADPTEALQNWMAAISRNLNELDEQIPEPLDEESIERLRALGYAD